MLNALACSSKRKTLKNYFYLNMTQLRKDKVYYILIKDLETTIGKTLNYKQVKENTLKLISRIYPITEGENILILVARNTVNLTILKTC